MNDYEKAFEYLDKSEALKDSIANYNRSLAINNISRKYETRMNKKEIKILELEKSNAIDKTKQQKRANTVLTIGFALLSLAIYYIIILLLLYHSCYLCDGWSLICIHETIILCSG